MEWNRLATSSFSGLLVGGCGVPAAIGFVLSAVHAQVTARRTGLHKPDLFAVAFARFYVRKPALARHASPDAWIGVQSGRDCSKQRFYAIAC